MMEVLNESGADVKEEVFKALERVLEWEGKEMEVSVALVGEERMRELNERYRKGEGATDVLTFVYEEGSGEVVICPQVVERYAKEEGMSFEERMLLTVVHAALHLCGYDHEFDDERADEMFRKQGEYFEKLREELL